MSCYHPNMMRQDLIHPKKSNGKNNYQFLGPYNGKSDKLCFDKSDLLVLVPCKHCIGCKLDYSREWADRMLLELDHSKKAVFVTLTYDKEHLPYGEFVDDVASPTLYKRHCQLFMKRLRDHFEGKEIRFFLSGEYGDKRGRPHYHAILFGLDMREDFPDFVFRGQNELGQPYFSSDILQSIWKYGFVGISDVTYKTFGYVARYCMKKAYKHLGAEERYDALGRIPEFSLMSRKPGIGMYFIQERGLDFLRFSCFDGEVGRTIALPHKLVEKLELTDPDRYAKLIADRKELALDSALLKLQKTDRDWLGLLSVEEEKVKNSIKSLRRKEL